MRLQRRAREVASNFPEFPEALLLIVQYTGAGNVVSPRTRGLMYVIFTVYRSTVGHTNEPCLYDLGLFNICKVLAPATPVGCSRSFSVVSFGVCPSEGTMRRL